MNWDRPCRHSVSFVLFAGCCLAFASDIFAAGQKRVVETPSVDFFERSIRPLLIRHCLECHQSESPEAGLRLDSALGFAKGGDSGPLVDRVDADRSRLLDVVRYQGDVRMPPDGKLTDLEIQTLTDWVKAGAEWPSDARLVPVETETEADASATMSASEAAKRHWSFQRPEAVKVPGTIAAEWCSTEVDAFILERLNAAGLEPSERADRRTLIRRATLDLHGLPPAPAEIREFLEDRREDAFRHLIDRLLESPRYGERWGRYWLDVARYSDTRGYVRLKDNPNYPAAWTYRDYVIRSFNQDLPWDRFIVEQIAADCEPATMNRQSLAALGYLTLGQRFINSQHDIIDDRIDVVTRGMLGLTVTCARCHDHKYDPISMDDYYGLHGIFASSREPDVPQLIVETNKVSEYGPYIDELHRRENVFADFLVAQQNQLQTSFRNRTAEYLVVAARERVQANFLPVMFLIDSKKDLNPVVIQKWARLFAATRLELHPILAPWHQFMAVGEVTEHEFQQRAQEILEAKTAEAETATTAVHPLVLKALRERPLKSLRDVATVYQTLQDRCIRETAPEWDDLKKFFYGEDAPTSVRLSEVDDFLFADATTQNLYHDQQRLVEDWIATAGAAPHAHTLMDSETPADSPIFLRGNASNPGRIVSRRFIQILASEKDRRYFNGSGRLELARDIASSENPLTARVIVNRVWLNHFGAGLVSTPGDFGIRGELPSHPELLDFLAVRFMDSGWSVKSLHRLLMNSAVYQQQSGPRAEASAVDPQNRLYWKMNRRRMDWEAMRDSLLFVSGDLDTSMWGPPVSLFDTEYSKRRTVYGRIDRQVLPSLLRTFDFAAPDQSVPQRHQTSVPQQTLYLMNSGFMKDRARSLAARLPGLRITKDTGPVQSEIAAIEDQLRDLFASVYGREPLDEEIQACISYLLDDGATDVGPEIGPSSATPPGSIESLQPQNEGHTALTRWEELCQVLLMSNEFQFID